MKILPKQYAIALYESTKNVSERELEKRVQSFVNMLKKNNDLSLADKIIQQYYKHCRKQKGISKLKIVSNKKLNREELDKILAKFTKQIEIEEVMDKTMLGGIVIKIDDEILIDGSVNRKIENLQKELV